MTNFFGTAGPTEVSDGYPGAAPVPGAGNQMQGNPNLEPSGSTNGLSGNQNAPQILAGTQISSGNISANSVPTNVLTAPGTDSLIAQMSRGQVLMCDSTYGQSGFIPQNGGASPQAVTPAANVSQPVTARVASTLAYPAVGSSQNYTGN
jgi:hypothetical protein